MSLRAFFFVLTAFLVLAPAPCHAAETDEVRFEPVSRVSGAALQLNGAGIRSRHSIRAYAIGLYLGATADSLDSAMAVPGAKRIEIVPLLTLPATLFSRPLVRGFKKNLPQDEFEAMQPRINAFTEQVLAIEEVKLGSRLAMEWIPGKGTRILVDGRQSGAAIQGEDFFRGLLAIWIGPRPTQDDLKAQLLAGKPAN
jgi:hypothetical protein